MIKKLATTVFLVASTMTGNAHADSCEIEERQASSSKGATSHNVILREDDKEVFSSKGTLTRRQAKKIVQSFCKSGTKPLIEINETFSLKDGNVLFCRNTEHSNITASAKSGWISASYTLKNADSIKSKSGDLSYTAAKRAALRHCAYKGPAQSSN